MRNTSEVGDVTRNAQFKSEYYYNKMTKNIESLPVKTNVSSSRPWLIPYLKTNRSQHLKKAIKKALGKTKEHGDALVLMFDSREIPIHEMKDILVEAGEDEKAITIHPDKSKQEGTGCLERFLRKPSGTYLVPHDNFTGCEAQKILFLLHEKNGYYDPTSIRCHLSRAVSHLVVVQEILINENFQQNYIFPSIQLDSSFMNCESTIKDETAELCECHGYVKGHHIFMTNEGVQECIKTLTCVQSV